MKKVIALAVAVVLAFSFASVVSAGTKSTQGTGFVDPEPIPVTQPNPKQAYLEYLKALKDLGLTP